MFGKTKSSFDADDVRKFCENDEALGKVLALFTEGYKESYNKRRVAHRQEVMLYFKRNFFRWFYCSANNNARLSPARYLASRMHHRFGEGFVALPIPSPVYSKTRLTGVEYSFRVFTLDEHPVFADLEMLAGAIRQWGSLDAAAARIELAFGNHHYLRFLAEICRGLGLFKESAGGQALDEAKLSEFFALRPKERLGAALNALLETFVEGLRERNVADNPPAVPLVLGLLSKPLDSDQFFRAAFPDMMEHMLNAEFDAEEFSENAHLAMANAAFKVQALMVETVSSIFVGCTLYLQIIQIESVSQFEFGEDDSDFLKNIPKDDLEIDENRKASLTNYIAMTSYFPPPSNYGLTPLGAKLFGKSYAKGQFSPLVNPKDFGGALDAMLAKRPPAPPKFGMDFLKALLGPGASGTELMHMTFDSDEEEYGEYEDYGDCGYGSSFEAPPIDSLLEELTKVAGKKFGEIDGAPKTRENDKARKPKKAAKKADPLAGLNPDNKPAHSAEDKLYLFSCKQGKAISEHFFRGSQTLSDFDAAIRQQFAGGPGGPALESAFYMGGRFLAKNREIRCPGESGGYRICDLKLYKGQVIKYMCGPDIRLQFVFEGYDD